MLTRVYGPPGRLEWLWRQPCVVVGCRTTDYRPGHSKVIESCHVRVGGVGWKADYSQTVPACWRHHDMMGSRGSVARQRFEREHRFRVAGVRVETLDEAAGLTEDAWQDHENGLAY